MPPVTASIPSPSSGFFELGPLDVHMYGLMLLLAIATCIVVTGLRWSKRPGDQGGDWDTLLRIAVWGVAAGIVGARAYHVVTSWSEVPDPKWQGVFMVWKGGLGVWGGILLGTIVGGYICRRSGKSALALMDAAAPGLLLAHGIGRFGNWWNQELFGEPTSRSWGLEIDPENRPFEFADAETFHPTFLYEFLYVTAAAVVLLILDRFFRFRPPALFALYVSLYTFGRFFEELLRIDPSHELGPFRLNAWVSIVVFVLSTTFFIYWQLIRGRGGRRGTREERRHEPPKGTPKMTIPKGRVRPSR